jgi:hypothetical protein
LTGQSTADVLRRTLSTAGIGALYGSALHGFGVTEAADPVVALLLAQAHRAVAGVPAVAHVGNGLLVVPGRSPEGGPAPAVPQARVVVDASVLSNLAPAVAEASQGRGIQLQLDVELSEPSTLGPVERPATVNGWLDDDTLAAIPSKGNVVVLAGPGVVQDDAVGGLRALAAAGRLGVLNTWGAKGVFHWQSRHHWATVGLQEFDLDLGGLSAADLVLVSGVDEREAPSRLWARDRHRVLPPGALGPLAELWPAGGSFHELPPLRPRLAAVTQAGWAATGVPLMPSRVTQHYAQVLGSGGLVAADPGIAGYWVARTFATTRLGSALVPAAPIRGWAAACATVARLAAPFRPVLAAMDGPLDDLTRAVLDAATRLGVSVGIETWELDGDALGVEQHLARLEILAAMGGRSTIRTNRRQLEDMVEVAGPIRAWTSDADGPDTQHMRI